LENFFAHPAVQAGVAPFAAALLVVMLLHRLRLGGLAVVAAFLTTYYLVAGFTFSPLTVTRKIALLAIAAPVVGMLADFAFKPTRIGAVVLALAGAAGALWAFYPVLSQKAAAEAWLMGASALVSIAWVVGFSQIALSEHPLRAGAAGLALGLGVGVAAIFGASATYGSDGIALGAASGAFLLPQLISGKRSFAGSTFTLSVTLTAGLLAAGTMILAKLPWYAVLVLALIPVAARLPVPERAPAWLQAFLLSLYGFTVAGVAWFLAWHS
jgi:hypothetical protein